MTCANYLLQQHQIAGWPSYVPFAVHFSPDECTHIIACAQGVQPETALVGDQQNNPDMRRSEIRWLPWSQEHHWVYERLDILTQHIRSYYYPFHLSGIFGGLQITHYSAAQNGHYTWHRDMGDAQMSNRKLSICMQLNASEEFDGGEFEMASIPDRKVPEMAQGTVIAFPAWEAHRVRPVTRGERWSLVAWLCGPPFS